MLLSSIALLTGIENEPICNNGSADKNSQLNVTKRLKNGLKEVSDKELEHSGTCSSELLLRLVLDTINDVFGKFMHYVQEFFKAAGANG